MLLLPADVRDQIVVHAVDSLPLEAVGVLAGTGNQVRMAFALRNVGGQQTFLAHPYDQFQAEMAIQSRDMEILAIYHSHPDGCVCLSDLDRLLATPWKCAQVLIGVDTTSKQITLAAYRPSGDVLVEIEVRVEVRRDAFEEEANRLDVRRKLANKL